MTQIFFRPLIRLSCTVALGAILLTPPAFAQEGDRSYKLGPRETLMIRVGQWDAVEGTYAAWTDLNGTYIISPDGRVSLPLAGEVPAEGLTTTELARAISAQLANRVGYGDQIEATVEILEFRPIYVLGGVRNPGAYPFSPGLTVLQALGLAGGLEREPSTFLRAERNTMTSLGNYEVLQLDLLRRLATVARLQAELDEQEPETPEELASTPFGAELMAREGEIKAARDAALQSSLSQLDSLERLLAQQIEALEEQIILRGRQLELAEEELESTATLVERGLSVASRRAALESQVAEQQVRRLELDTARLNAEQRLNEAGREKLDLVNNRRREIVENIRAERSAIEELRVRMRTEAALYAESTRFEDGFVRAEGLGAPVMEVTRRVNGEVQMITASRSEELLPGDVLELRIPDLEETPASAAPRPGAMQPASLSSN